MHASVLCGVSLIGFLAWQTNFGMLINIFKFNRFIAVSAQDLNSKNIYG